jgi:NAD+ synthase (glutamine-hydrolysing)
VEIIGNGSGSHHELRKLNTRLDLMINATRKCGGVYLYANQRGCDGGRCYYDGGAMIVCNGQVLAQASQFGLQDVEVVTATVDLEDVRSYRASIPSFGMQAQALESNTSNYILCDNAKLCYNPNGVDLQEPNPTESISLRSHLSEEECLLGPALWMWDYLRRSGAAGFFLPLSGGADSSSVATIAHAMCDLVTKAAQADPSGKIAQDCRRVCRMEECPGDPLWVPPRSQDMANRVLHTTFMGTENSSDATRSRAQRLATSVGAYHLSIRIDSVVEAMVKMFSIATGHAPRYSVHGGANAEDLALQNIQARLRMVTAYLFAQLLPLVRGKNGFLLVLASANVDEGLRGYMTKYDCSSGDLNPIGAISKTDLKRMLLFAAKKYDMSVLGEIADAPPTAELRPNSTAAGGVDIEHSQKDEDEMGMTYEELSYFGRLRKLYRCGPVSMFRKLRVIWSHLSPMEVAVKVKRFFFYYSVNRHKMCTITPAYHAEGYSPDDNRFDLRQFLYNTKWTRQFSVIDDMARLYSNNIAAASKAGSQSKGLASPSRVVTDSPVVSRKKDV